MTNVVKQNSWKEMITFKQNQAESNLDEIFGTLDELKIPSSPAQIRDHMNRKANEKATKEANEKYESGEITRIDRDRYIKKFGKTMALRTIQRWLAKYTAYGYVAYMNNGY
jgi:type I site-specific restriction-modification system R (restriction) subunit